MEFKGLRRASLASSGETTAAAPADLAVATAELKNDDDDELQGNSKFLPAGTCHAAAASDPRRATDRCA